MSARLFACLLLLALASPVAAQTGKKYAFLVGVREYAHARLPDLKYTENDVEELATLLRSRRGGFAEVILLTSSRGSKDAMAQPTIDNIRDQLKKITAKVNKHDLLLVALAGHGLQYPVVDDRTKREKDESFFCPADARPRGGQTFAELSKTMISLGDLFRELDESGAGVKLMLVDACRNDATARNIGTDVLPNPPRGTAALFSCKSGERAWESAKLGKGHGVFFYFVLEGLKGKATSPKGDVTWSRLTDYVSERVADTVPVLIGGGADQTPHSLANLAGRSPVLLRALAPDDDKAEKLFQAGMSQYAGQDGTIDYDLARQFFTESADQGHPVAQAMLAWLANNGYGEEKDEARARRLIAKALPGLKKLAAADNPDAQLRLGGLYFAGLGVERDFGEAVRLYKAAAKQDHTLAMTALGVCYANARGVAKDDVESVKWYRKSAQRGDPFATINLGWMYENDRVREADSREAALAEAARLYKLAAGKGDATALFNLGVMHGEGRGVKKDRKEAALWFRRAARKGFVQAMHNLAGMYEAGEGVERDYREALSWYRKAAERGDMHSMYQLGEMHENGRGVEKSRKEALRWYRQAAEKGHEGAKEKVRDLSEA